MQASRLEIGAGCLLDKQKQGPWQQKQGLGLENRKAGLGNRNGDRTEIGCIDCMHRINRKLRLKKESTTTSSGAKKDKRNIIDCRN